LRNCVQTAVYTFFCLPALDSLERHVKIILSPFSFPPLLSSSPLRQYILCCTEDPPVSSLSAVTGVRAQNFGSFWVFLEYKPNIRNLTAAANVIADEISTQRLVTFNHLIRRHGMEEYYWPQNTFQFDCAVTLGSFCGLTAFAIIAFGMLATCICGAKKESLCLNES
jgi:hypothetical protein